MKKPAIIILSLFVILYVLITSAPADNTKTGKLDLSERIFDFGMVPREAAMTHDFLLKNVGNDTLRITKIKPTCGCTTAPVRKKVLAVGDSTVMEVTFKSGRISGSTIKAINVTTDMKPRGLFPVKIQAYVESPTMKPPKFYAEPRQIEYQPEKISASGSGKTVLKNEYDYDVEATIVDYSDEIGAVKLSSNKISAGSNAELIFSFAELSSQKELNGSVTLEINGGENGSYRYTVPVVRKRPADLSQK